MSLSEGSRDKKKKKQATYKANKKAKYISETRDEKGEIKIPEGVSNKKAYLEYIQLYDEVHEDLDLDYQTSDIDVQINLLASPYVINQIIDHLPKEEKERILAISNRLRSKGALAAYKKKLAFGGDNRYKQGMDIMHPTKHHKRFFEERGSELIEYFGRYFTLEEVHKVITVEWGNLIQVGTLRQWRIDNLEAINIRQEQFKKDYSDIRLGYKRSRLDALNYLYQTRLDIYKGDKDRRDSVEIRLILEQVRKEVEGDQLTIGGSLNVKHEHLIKSQIDQNLMQGLNVKALILSRVAQKLNINPMVLQYQLINSYYAKFTGFQPADDNILTDEIIYPSSTIYDFDVLREKNRKIEAEEAEIIEELTVKVDGDDEKQKIMDMKAQVMKRLIERRQMNNKTQENIATKTTKGNGK